MNGAGSTRRNTTTIFGAGHVEHIPEHPQQRHGWLCIYGVLLTIDSKYHRIKCLITQVNNLRSDNDKNVLIEFIEYEEMINYAGLSSIKSVQNLIDLN